jgi:hypothetical protein
MSKLTDERIKEVYTRLLPELTAATTSDAIDIARAIEAELQPTIDFYQRRVDALQEAQSQMRDPERTMVCDIIANGKLDPMIGKDRYKVKQETEEELRARFERVAKQENWDIETAVDSNNEYYDYRTQDLYKIFKAGANP